jgi:hypothetical protein
MRTALAMVVLAGVASAASAQDISSVNGYQTYGRLFNDFQNSSLSINGVNTPTGMSSPVIGSISGVSSVQFNEQFAQGEPGNFANKHVAWLSNDGGASRFQTNQFQSFTMSFSVNIAAPAGAPRKEAGIEVWQPRPALGFQDEGQVLIASDGEVAVFGGTMPFTGLGSVYTLGTTAQVTWEYFAPGIQDPTKGAYRLTFVDAVTGAHSSGIKVWGTEPDNIAGHTGAFLGLKAQNQRNPFIADSSVITYGNVSIVPAPAGVAALGLAGLAASRRRRAK